ncbi:MAG: carnitine 3-dehydrogenase [Pseudomonadota bacterium]
MKAAIVGGGVIGGGWAARFLLNGWDVDVFDPNPRCREQIDAVLDRARRSLPALADQPMPAEGQLTIASTLAEAVTDANWVQESVSENLELKHKVIAEIQTNAPSDTLIGSSTSGFKPSELQQGAADPGRIVVAHPFNPVYLLPLVEIVAGPAVDAATCDRACNTITSIGMYPLRVKKEIDAHIADRFLEAVWREGLWLINDGIATAADIDDAIRYGFGLRWAQMGMFQTYQLAGGEEGMVHFLRQFGPALEWPWTKLMDVPELTDDLVQTIAEQTEVASGDYTIEQLADIRDRNLVGILRTLKERDWGAGAILNAFDKTLANTTVAADDCGDVAPLRLLAGTVLPAWIDYNGHMTEFRYVQVFSDSSEVLLSRVGMHTEYVDAGNSWYTAETHTQYFDEVAVNEPFYTTVQIIMADAKRLHVYYRMHAASDDRLLAALEAMYLHVNMQSGRVVAAEDSAAASLLQLAEQHGSLDKPDAVGRFVGQR